MKYLILLIIILIPALLFGKGQSTSGYRRISQEEAHRIMQEDEKAIILDVRTPSEYKSGHIRNAINIPNETIDEDIVDNLPDKNTTILVYCRSGNRSRQASGKLADLGYANVLEFGGINTWKYGLEE